MKKLLTILFLFCGLISQAQLGGTDTAHFIDRANQWFSTNPYISLTANFKLARILFHPSQYAAASLPTGSTGSIIWDTDSLRFRYYNGTEWVLMTPDGGGGVAGVTSFNSRTGAVTLLAADVTGVGGYINGGNTFGANATIGLTDNFSLGVRTNGTDRISITGAGAVSMPTGPLTVGGTSNGVINIQSSAASTRGSIDLSSNNPRLNSATGTWIFAQSGNTVGLYNATGFFFGGGTTPSGFVVGVLAGTTSNAPIRLFSGPVTTTAVAGNVEFLTDDLFFTITTGAARKPVALWEALGTSGRVPFNTTNGRLTDNANFRYVSNELIVGSASDAGAFTLQNTGGLFQSGAVKIDLGSDATGDIYYRDGSGNFVRLPIGSTSNVLTVSGGGLPTWSAPVTTLGSVYTPTLTAVANVDAVSAPAQWSYIQIGSQVYVWGSADVDPTSASTVTQFRVSLPVTASFADENEAAGNGTFTNSSGQESMTIKAETTNEQAIFTWFTGTTANQRVFFSFGYRLGGS